MMSFNTDYRSLRGSCKFSRLPLLASADMIFISERGNKEVQLADVLSPVSKKKTGRAYVALARAHSEK